MKIGDIVFSGGKKYKISEIIDGDVIPAISAHPVKGDFVYTRTVKYLGTDYDRGILTGKPVRKQKKLSVAVLGWRKRQHRKNPELWPIERVYGGIWERKSKFTG